MKRKVFFVLSAVVILYGCSAAEGTDKLFVMSWNVQNLFDDIDNGTEYYEFDPGAGDWNYDSFSRKASAVADVISASVSGGPDIIVMQEIENENALKYLNENCLKASCYTYSLFFPTEDSAVGTAVLSRFPIEAANSHAVNFGGKPAGRNISDFIVSIPGDAEPLVIIINHWKSKLGGAEETEGSRIEAARLLSELIRIRLEEHSGAVLAAGDFNESHDEFERIGGLYATAMANGGLAGAEELELYNPWDDAACEGSYYYDNRWETIDQFFLSEGFFDGAGWDYSSFSIAAVDFNSTVDGKPLGWRSSTNTGASDHFPILLELKKAE